MQFKTANHNYNLRSGFRQPKLVADKMAEQVVMSSEQLQALLNGMRQIFASGNAGVGTPNQTGNFSQCKSRFSGMKDDDVEAFIAAICVYKDCVNITDSNALKGLPMLLDKLAATWWQGVKDTTKTWEDALSALRHSFGINKPPHKIFRELFARQQGDNEPTDVFVSAARALLSRLPATPVLDETYKMDMIYGLLNRRIRQRLKRDEITSFECLIEKARDIEDSFLEIASSKINLSKQ